MGETDFDKSDVGKALLEKIDRNWMLDKILNSYEGMFYSFVCPNSTNGFNTYTTNSGDVIADWRAFRFNTGLTSDSIAQAEKAPNYLPTKQRTWDRDRYFQSVIYIQEPVSNSEYRVGVGSTNLTDEHIFFKVVNGDLIASVADGSTENTSAVIETLSQGDNRVLEGEMDNSVPEARFYVDNSKVATLSSNLPSGTAHANKPFCGYAHNSVAAIREIRVSKHIYYQK